MDFLTVVAPQGKTCPKEMSREVITDSNPVQVPNSSFYRRLISEGSLVLQSPAAGNDRTAPSPKRPRGGSK